MRESQTAVLERGAELQDQLETEPFETAWAGEARWFVQFLTPDPGAEITIIPQISPDGLAWVDHETGPVTVPAEGLSTLSLADFGHWVRLRLRRTGGSAPPLVRVYLALKE
ncbi:MAG TPA: DUF6385 domain-containing protein [Microlunatus sp.]|nr:DUF6385 domain-containing protein [Microlunatus sp.]